MIELIVISLPQPILLNMHRNGGGASKCQLGKADVCIGPEPAKRKDYSTDYALG